MIDLVTVVFRDELPILESQAASVELYCQNIGIRNIYVVVNDEPGSCCIDPTWWGDLADCVTVIPRSVFGTEFVSNGWVSQQALKLLAAAASSNTWSMVLDAKTVFVREVKLPELIDSQGRACVGTMSTFPVFEPARLIVNQLFNIDMTQQLGPGGVPFMLHNHTVREMIHKISAQTGCDFLSWFQAQGVLTEFMLYSGYVQYCFENFNTLYSSRLQFQPVNVCHSEVAAWDRKLIEMQQPKTLTASVHRTAWKQLTNNQQQQYQNFLIDRGIVGAQQL